MPCSTVRMSPIAYRPHASDHPERHLGPNQEDWWRIKDVFTRLYIAENRKLRDVKEILSKHHGINASEKMYKRRIAEWKIHKNYKAQEKEILARKVKACVDAGHSLDSISFRGRPLKLDRVRRHCRNDKKLARLWEHLSQSPQDTAAEDFVVHESKGLIRANLQSAPAVPCVLKGTAVTTSFNNLNPITDSSRISSEPGLVMEQTPLSAPHKLPAQIDEPTDLHATNAVLFYTKGALDWQFTAFTRVKLNDIQSRFPGQIPVEVVTGQVDQVSAFWLALYHGYVSLKAGNHAQAFKTLNNSCQMVQPLLATLHCNFYHACFCILPKHGTVWTPSNSNCWGSYRQ